MIKIVSDGTPINTHVYTAAGVEIEGITNIYMAISYNTLMTAKLVFENVELSIQANWENHPLKQWAVRKRSGG